MNTPTTISPFEQFQQLFPDHRLIAYPDELKYRLRSEIVGRAYEDTARGIILEQGLPLTANLEIWRVGGIVREVCLVVKMVPEEIEFRHA